MQKYLMELKEVKLKGTSVGPIQMLKICISIVSSSIGDNPWDLL